MLQEFPPEYPSHVYSLYVIFSISWPLRAVVWFCKKLLNILKQYNYECLYITLPKINVNGSMK